MRFLLSSVLILLVVGITGCDTQNSKQSVTTHDGLPSPRWQVGGGLEIEYTAPVDGIAYVVDQTSGRFLVTETIEAGEEFDFSLLNDVDQGLYGITPASRVVLYFVPADVFYPPTESQPQ